ncbi:response regulator [candidate division KSB1 bacterium]|nr:response regulator [candidate division KSB1 bacterium]
MSYYNIIIIDKDQKNLKILENNFIQAGFNVDKASTDVEALNLLKKRPFHIIISELSGPGIDGYRLLEKIQGDPSISNIPVVFLTVKSDTWNRIKSFKLGAKDYIVKPKHVKEIVSRVQMILNRLDRRNKEETLDRKKLAGRIENFSVSDLVKVFGIEKKTGILSIFNENGLAGQIFFNNGLITNAQTETLKAEEAIFKMMSWNKGRFSMLFCDVNVSDIMSTSNFGILLQGAKRMEQREELLKELPSLEAVVVTSSNFKKIIDQKELASDLKIFLKLFDGERQLKRVIDDSQEDEITTLKRILKLYKLGFLHILHDFSKAEPASNSIKQPVDHPEPLQPKDDAWFPEEATHPLFEPKSHSPGKAEIIEPNFSKSTYENDFAEQQQNSSSIFENDPFFDYKKDQKGFGSEEELILESGENDKELDFSTPQIPDKHPADALFELAPEKKTKTEVKTFYQAPQKQKQNPSQLEFERAQQQIKAKALFKKAKGAILVLGSNRKQFIECLATNGPVESKIGQDVSEIYYGTAVFKGGQALNFISFSQENEFTSLINYFKPTCLGYIFIIEAGHSVDHYTKYLVNILEEKLGLPHKIIIHGKDTSYNDVEKIKAEIGFSKNIKLCPEINETNAKKIIFSLFENYYKKKNYTHELENV